MALPTPLGALASRFEVLALAGEGGMGRVYRARDRSSGRIVALKLLPERGGDVSRFTREAQILERLDLPGVVRHLEHGTGQGAGAGDGSGEAPYLIMEWLAGHDLGDRLQRGRLTFGETLTLARRVAETLGAAHAAGIVHRDLKPGNLFLVEGRLDGAKIVDFGLARPLGDPSLSSSRELLGTPAYMPPEQIRGDDVDARADVYALGAVLFRCVAGRLPFLGAHPLAILAKVMVEPPPPLADLCEVPADFADLVARMLAKHPSNRPEDGRELASELARIGDAAPDDRRAAPAITARERRVECVVLCAGATSDDATVPTATFASYDDRVRTSIAELGGDIEALAKGAWLVTIRGAASPAEQAVRAARCGLLLRDARPSAPIVLATGKVVAGGGQQVGEAIDRAALALVAAKEQGTRGVLVDEATASLLDDRFELRGGDLFRELVGEEDAETPARTLLGHRSICVGREMPLATLDAAASAAFDEESGRLALITAAPGMGKSRLVAELRGRIRSRGDVDVLVVRGEGQRVASSLGLVGGILRAAAHVGPGLHPDEAARAVRLTVSEDLGGADAPAADLLADLARVVSTSSGSASGPSSAAASREHRAPPIVAAEATKRALSAWLVGRVASRPTLLVLEDVHWADAASIALISDAVDACASRPLFVVATSRPELPAATRDALRPALELRLGPLAPRAAERLVREALGDRASAVDIALMLDRAGGHPFQLEELVRAFAEGKGPAALPDSVIGMVQARLDGADAGARRVLRAASVFGTGFTAPGIAALLGDEVELLDIERAITDLVRLEMVTRKRTPGGDVLGFAHGLVCDAAYAMLDDADRVLAHRLAAAWLEASGEVGPTALADHFERGGALGRAAELYGRAARVALDRGDFAGAIDEVKRALACGPQGDQRGTLAGIQSAALYWSGQLDAAAERADAAASEVTFGGTSWFEAVAVAVAANGQLGRNDEVARWVDRAASVTAGGAAEESQLVALSRGAVQLLWAHHAADFDAILARVATAQAGGETSAYTAGWVHRVRGEAAWVRDRDVDRCRDELAASAASFTRAGALRDACLTQLNRASLAGWAGEIDGSRALLAMAAFEVEQRGGFLLTYAELVGSFMHVFAGAPDAEPAIEKVLPKLAGSPRLSFLCLISLSHLALARDDAAAAEARAVTASSLAVAAELAPAAPASRARALVAMRRFDEALPLAEAAHLAAERGSDLDLLEGLTVVALAEARAACGDAAGALEVARAGHARLARIAGTIASEERRAAFWNQRLVHHRVAELARPDDRSAD